MLTFQQQTFLKLKTIAVCRYCTDVVEKVRKPNANLLKYIKNNVELTQYKEYIPDKYLTLKRRFTTENFYLIDPIIANTIATHVLNGIRNVRKHIICETSAGLGLISAHLLNKGVNSLRIYESCPQFRKYLKEYFSYHYPNRFQLINKDFFQLSKLAFVDKFDNKNRVDEVLNIPPGRTWKDEPGMTIVGSLPKSSFILYLIKLLALQSNALAHGRFQLYAVLRPGDYLKLSAGPENNLHTYQHWTVLFNILFDYQLLDKFTRLAFLPWETELKITPRTRVATKEDIDHMYFVRINFKKNLPVEFDDLLPLYFFVRQSFGKGNNKIIPTIERWIPGIGENLIAPTQKHTHYFKNMNIFTTFGELKPLEILSLFQEMIAHPHYVGSSFAAMVQSELIRTETKETSLLQPDEIIDELEQKL